MSDTEDGKLVEELRALDDETMCFDGPATYALIHRAAATIERLREMYRVSVLAHESALDRANAADSALSTARTTAFREAADTPPGVKSLILTADDCDKAGMSNSESACVLVGWLRELRTAVAALDAKAKEDTQT